MKIVGCSGGISALGLYTIAHDGFKNHELKQRGWAVLGFTGSEVELTYSVIMKIREAFRLTLLNEKFAELLAWHPFKLEYNWP